MLRINFTTSCKTIQTPNEIKMFNAHSLPWVKLSSSEFIQCIWILYKMFEFAKALVFCNKLINDAHNQELLQKEGAKWNINDMWTLRVQFNSCFNLLYYNVISNLSIIWFRTFKLLGIFTVPISTSQVSDRKLGLRKWLCSADL